MGATWGTGFPQSVVCNIGRNHILMEGSVSQAKPWKKWGKDGGALGEPLFSDKNITAHTQFTACFWYLNVGELELERNYPWLWNHISLGNIFENCKWKFSLANVEKPLLKVSD